MLVSETVRRLGGLDIVVNNAARQFGDGPLSTMTNERFDAILKTNLYSIFWITREALAHLTSGSCIINTASVQAYNPSAGLPVYAASKAGVVALTKSLAKELSGKGVRVNAVAPGPVWTPMQTAGLEDPQNITGFGRDAPFGRPAQPAELAPAYVLLATEEGSYATGQVWGVAGGGGFP